MKQINKFGKSRVGRSSQRGGLTIFSAALILIMMTMVLVYATRVSLFESRISGNEVRQKEAFHVTEAALDQGVMYLLANAGRLLSSREDVFPDAGGGFTDDGWLSAAGSRWMLCSDALADGVDMTTHPCGGDVTAISGSYFYDTDDDSSTIEALPINQVDFPDDTTARLTALLCFVDLDTPIPCTGNPGSAGDESNATLLLTLLAYGFSDCTDTTDPTTCTGEAAIALPISNFSKLAGSPAVPFVTKATFPPQGTVEIVGNPNAGGVGVPVTTWVNANTVANPTGTCLQGTPITSSGSWQTCEMEEWYHTNDRPEGVACTDNNCMCGPGGNDTDHFLSWKTGGDTNIGIDIVEDDQFPCDLFEFFFGVKRAFYHQIKNAPGTKVYSDCGSLGPSSAGIIWIKGSSCAIQGGTVVGSPLAPVVLVSAADVTTINGGSTIFGVLYIFDDDPAGNGAELKSTGGATVYGAVIVDGSIDKLQGTFQVVYNEDVLLAASGIAGLGSVNGGWRDFGLPDVW